MDPAKTEHFKEKLLELKRSIQKEVDNINRELRESMKDSVEELSSYDNHTSDLGAETFERGKDISLRDNEKIILKKINEALKRIQKGTFGKCIKCGESISMERLESQPYAAYCIKCQEEFDKSDNERTRPVEEEVLFPPFGRSFLDNTSTQKVEYDGEDAWQDVARYGTANSPQDVPESTNYDDLYIDSKESRGAVEETDKIVDDKEENDKVAEKED